MGSNRASSRPQPGRPIQLGPRRYSPGSLFAPRTPSCIKTLCATLRTRWQSGNPSLTPLMDKDTWFRGSIPVETTLLGISMGFPTGWSNFSFKCSYPSNDLQGRSPNVSRCAIVLKRAAAPQHCLWPPMFSLPSIPTDLLSAWIQPGAVLGFIGLLLAALHRMRTELREEIRASEARLKEENQASEARQAKRTDELRADMKEMRADNRALEKNGSALGSTHCRQANLNSPQQASQNIDHPPLWRGLTYDSAEPLPRTISTTDFSTTKDQEAKSHENFTLPH